MFHTSASTPMSSSHSHKRRQSHSPSPPSKRRAPPSYIPSLYAPIPTSASALPNFNRSLSVEASYGGTPISERSSPGLDWLQRTEDLHLATPLGRVNDQNGDSEMDSAMQDDSSHPAPPPQSYASEDPHIHSYSPRPAMPLSHSNSSCPSPHPHPSAPHEAPPLHQHLAGSPSSMTRSDSNTSSNSSISGMAGHLIQPFPQTHTISYSNETEMDTSMDHSQPSQGGHGQGRGWKITMGYRSDCEKCLQRVPGHYTHVVYSS